jgi:sortase (surface protein transpeptidase)
MKRILALTFLALLIATSIPSYAQKRITPEENARLSQKAQKKQLKAMKKAAKRQQKAMKKSAKGQQKALKNAHQRGAR